MISPSGDLVLSPADAARLARVVKLGITTLDRRGGGVPPETVRLLGEITEAATRLRARLSRLDASSATEPVAVHGKPAGFSLDNDKGLTVTEAARIAGVNVSYVRRLAGQKAFIADRTAKGWRIDPASFAAWLDSRNE
jgi:hypothetical protein